MVTLPNMAQQLPALSTPGGTVKGDLGATPLYLPLRNETVRRDVIVEVPEVHVVEKLVPKIRVQDVIRKVPKVDVQWIDKVVEVPQIQVVDKIVEVPEVREVRREIPRVEVKQIVRHIPRYHLQQIEKYVEVPQIQYVEKYVEVPEVHQVIRFKEKVHVVDVPIENIRTVPNVQLKVVEKVRHLPGPVEVIGVPGPSPPVIVERPPVAVPLLPLEQAPVPIFYQALPVPAPQPTVGYPCVLPASPTPSTPSSPCLSYFTPLSSSRFSSSSSSPLYTPDVPSFSSGASAAPLPRAPLVQPIIENQIINEGPIYQQAPPRYVYGGSVWAPPVYETGSPPIEADANFLLPPSTALAT